MLRHLPKLIDQKLVKKKITEMSSRLAQLIAVGAGGLGFDFRAGHISHSVANGSPLLRRFFVALLPRR